jgi:hypothetical protein
LNGRIVAAFPPEALHVFERELARVSAEVQPSCTAISDASKTRGYFFMSIMRE